MQGEICNGTAGGQVVAVGGMTVAIRKREVGACDLDAGPVASREVVRGGDTSDLDPVDLARRRCPMSANSGHIDLNSLHLIIRTLASAADRLADSPGAADQVITALGLAPHP